MKTGATVHYPGVKPDRHVDQTGQVRWQGARWIVPEGLLQTTVQLHYDPHHPDVLTVWQQDPGWGPAVRSDQAVPDPAAPAAPAAPPPGSGLSYLTLLTTPQPARRPVVAYAAAEDRP
jgi:hypothetical protein